MRHDFSTVDEPEMDLIFVTPGRYLCRVREVRERATKDGAHDQWALCLALAEGEHAGHLAAWDNLTFSERGLPRVKLVLRALGCDVSGVVEIEPAELEGRLVVCDLIESSYTDPATGHKTRRLVVPYRGYMHPSTWDGDGDGLGLGRSGNGRSGGQSSDSASESASDPAGESQGAAGSRTAVAQQQLHPF